MSSRHMSQLLVCQMTIWIHCDSLFGIMWDPKMSPVPPLYRHLDYVIRMCLHPERRSW